MHGNRPKLKVKMDGMGGKFSYYNITTYKDALNSSFHLCYNGEFIKDSSSSIFAFIVEEKAGKGGNFIMPFLQLLFYHFLLMSDSIHAFAPFNIDIIFKKIFIVFIFFPPHAVSGGIAWNQRRRLLFILSHCLLFHFFGIS